VVQALSYVFQAENVTEVARGLALAAALARKSGVAKCLAMDDSLDIVAHFLCTPASLFVAIAPFLRPEGDDAPIREAVAAVVDAIHRMALLPRSNEWEALINEAILPALTEFVSNKLMSSQMVYVS
jgi:hypothetical protein